jgi:hypothetical protein
VDYFVRLMEQLLLLSSYLGDEVIKIASISRCHPDIAQEIAPVIEDVHKFCGFYKALLVQTLCSGHFFESADKTAECPMHAS